MTTEITVPALSGLKSVEPLSNPVFISDLHLAPNKPKTIMGFLRFMKDFAPRFSELVILGDLFDFWIGDDAMQDAQPIIATLKLFSASGRRVLVMPGNRDVLLGQGFAQAAGAELLSDPIVVEVKGRKVLLAHGDQWCLKDESYQQLRAMVRNPQWQAQVLMKSIPERLAIAQEARTNSEEDKSQKTPAQMDVVESAVAKSAREAGVDLVIHGHTHRPAGHVNAAIERWVLPDWELDNTDCSGRSGYLYFTAESRPQILMV